MTQPDRERIDLHDRQALSFEQQAARDMAQPVRQQIEQANQQIFATYVALAGSLEAELPEHLRPVMIEAIVRLLTNIRIATRPHLERIAAHGVRLGLQQAATVLPVRGVRPTVPPRLQNILERLDNRARVDLHTAVTTAQMLPVRDLAGVQRVVAQATKAANTVERSVRWVANRAVAEGTSRVAEEHRVPRLWVAERDACLHCLAYAGQLAGPGEPFPGGLTFYISPAGVAKPLGTEPVDDPPLHPNCRCRVTPWLGSLVGVGPAELPEVLKREAQRSVLRGFTNHASEPAALRAADRLLARGSVLPRSVQDRARRDVQAGRFGSAGRGRPTQAPRGRSPRRP